MDVTSDDIRSNQEKHWGGKASTSSRDLVMIVCYALLKRYEYGGTVSRVCCAEHGNELYFHVLCIEQYRNLMLIHIDP